MKKYLAFYLLVLAGCSSRDTRHDQIKIFLTEWSSALSAKDESVRKFYDSRFVFPKVVFESVQDLHYTFDIDHVEIGDIDNDGIMQVTVPFQVTDPTSTNSGHLVLTILKTKTGYLIEDMSQELAVKIKEQSMRIQLSMAPEKELHYDSILNTIRSLATTLSKQYDSVVYFSKVGDVLLFYVVNGKWKAPYEESQQNVSVNFKMGVVTAENKVIIPVEYSRIYNPNGSFENMIEVERNGLRGLFSVTGSEIIPAEFDGLYPANLTGVIAQVKKGNSYGWVDNNGKVSFDPASHSNKKLFQSPIESQMVLEWTFRYPGSICILDDPFGSDERTGVIIFPSYLHDLGATPIANTDVMVADGDFGMGMTDTEIYVEQVETLSDKFFALITFFMEAGADARGYHSSKNDLLVIDKSLNPVDHLERLTGDDFIQDPCVGRSPQYQTLEKGTYQSDDGHGKFTYYRVTDEGKVEELKTVRDYNFTKFARISERYFDRCYYESLDWVEGQPNLVIYSGISSEQLDIMRNEIYAEYGFIFKSQKWKTYFASKPWYKPQYDNVDHLLTETDKYNLKFILEYQQAHKNLQIKRDSIQYMWAG